MSTLTFLLPEYCRKSITAIVTVLFASFINAAAPDAYTYPLEQILAIAESNAKELKIIETETDVQLAEVDIYKSEVMPGLSFGTGVSYLSHSQAADMMEPAMMSALFGTTAYNGTVNGFLYPDRINGSVVNWSLNLQQPLNFFKLNTVLKLARIKYCSVKDLKRLKKDLYYYRVIQEFLAVYSAQLNVSIHQSAIDRSVQLKNRKESEFNAGREIKREVLRIESNVQGNRARLFAAECSLEISRKQLLKTINFKNDSTIILEFDENGKMYTIPGSTGPGSIQLFLKHNEAAFYKEQSNYLRSKFFPTVNLIGSISNQFVVTDTSGLVYDLLPSITPYPDIQLMERNLGRYNPKLSNYFNPAFLNYTIGLQLSWTLFDGTRTKAHYRQAKLQAKQVLMELDTLKSNLSIAVEEARYRIHSIDNTISAIRLQVEAAYQALSQTEQDYNAGVTDFSTLLDVDKEHRESVRLLNELKMQRVLALADLRLAMGLPVYGDHQ